MKTNLTSKFCLPLLMGCMAALFSCHHHQEVAPVLPPDKTAEVAITRPALNHVCHTGDSLHMTGQITAPEIIHGYHLTIRRKPENTVVYQYHGHDHATAVTFDKKWLNTITEPCEMELEVLVALDHDGGTLSKKTTFTCMP